MSISLSKFYQLKNKIIKHLGKNVVDIVLFGSYVRGKDNPKDYDICIVLRQKLGSEATVYMNKKMNHRDNIHLSYLSVDEFFCKMHSLGKTVFLEGISLISKERLVKRYGLDACALYTYDLSKINPSKKVRFVFLLKGRSKGNGLIKKMNGEFLSSANFIIPLEKDDEVSRIFDSWQIPFKRRIIMLTS